MKQNLVHSNQKNRQQKNRQQKNAQRGVALLEVLIAFFILSIGLLGLAGMQIKALQFNQASAQRSQATAAAYGMLDRMRLNRFEATGNSYDIAWMSSHGAGQIVDNDLNEWLVNINSSLPDGEGMIACDANEVCTISVRWSNRFHDPADPADDFEIISLTTEI